MHQRQEGQDMGVEMSRSIEEMLKEGATLTLEPEPFRTSRWRRQARFLKVCEEEQYLTQ
ncbi:MAG: hypothetical protein ACLVIY_03765 [Anaerobutyricum soehngenii]